MLRSPPVRQTGHRVSATRSSPRRPHHAPELRGRHFRHLQVICTQRAPHHPGSPPPHRTDWQHSTGNEPAGNLPIRARRPGPAEEPPQTKRACPGQPCPDGARWQSVQQVPDQVISFDVRAAAAYADVVSSRERAGIPIDGPTPRSRLFAAPTAPPSPPATSRTSTQHRDPRHRSLAGADRG
jgi:hypothetical protein